MARPKAKEQYVGLNVYLYERHLKWLNRQEENKSETIRNLIDEKIANEVYINEFTKSL